MKGAGAWGRKAYLLLGLLLVLLGGGGVSLGRASTQGEYVAAAGAQSLYRLQVAKGRGTIYDRNGAAPGGDHPGALGGGGPHPGVHRGRWRPPPTGRSRSRLALALEDGKPFVLTLPTLVDHPCVDLFTVPRRYGEDQLAPHLIGYLDSQGRGAAGVELAMDDLLRPRGERSPSPTRWTPWGGSSPGESGWWRTRWGRARPGWVLTLDGELQKLAEEASADLGAGGGG